MNVSLQGYAAEESAFAQSGGALHIFQFSNHPLLNLRRFVLSELHAASRGYNTFTRPVSDKSAPRTFTMQQVLIYCVWEHNQARVQDSAGGALESMADDENLSVS